MSFGYYFNIEIMDLLIVDDCTEKMTDSNSLENEELSMFCDEISFLNNFKNGYIAITMLSNYFESCLNTILREKYRCKNGDEILRANYMLKMEYLFRDNPRGFKRIKSEHEWSSFTNMNRLRNGLIHYKINDIGYASGPPVFKWKVEGQIVGNYFLKTNINQTKIAVIHLVTDIAESLECTVINNEDIITCDARDGCFSYILTNKSAAIRNSRESF